MNTGLVASSSREIAIAGDVCLDIIGIPIPRPDLKDLDNWRQTGETRTHYLPGGALLLARWVRAAAKNWTVKGTIPCLPECLAHSHEKSQPTNEESEIQQTRRFLDLAERITRDEVVHSLLAVDSFPKTPEAKKDDRRLRLAATHGFSGPKDGEPQLKVLPPRSNGHAQIIVLDDTGNRFRRTREHWPAALEQKGVDQNAVVVHKLHRPLPQPPAKEGDGENTALPDRGLWPEVVRRYPSQRIVIISIDDLREADAPISRGLSWERTALEVVWQLLNVEKFSELRESPHLIIRMGLDGALYWRRGEGKKSDHQAWLIYDPTGIEGTAESQLAGKMVGYGSAFTAAFVGELAKELESPDKTTGNIWQGDKNQPPAWIISGIERGLNASRRLLLIGYGDGKSATPIYPEIDLFTETTAKSEFFASKSAFFACEPIPIIPNAAIPDRGYWRLLDSIFHGRKALLHQAVKLFATGAKANTTDEKEAADLLKKVPLAVFAKALRTHDRREIENYRALYNLMRDYVSKINPPRPLSLAVFGPPGAGKSFGVKKVAEALQQAGGPREIETKTFNLSQYQNPEQLADAFHLVRDIVLRGKIPLVFFDEFDTSLGSEKLGWLRNFLAPMQDAEFLDNGAPHPIGQAIFVFAGGTCATYAEFAKPFLDPKDDKERQEFKERKGPDFLSRLRGTLDIPGLDLHAQFDPYGPVEAFPCEAAILLRRAGILAHQLGEKAPQLRSANGVLRVSEVVLRALLHMPGFVHGNRSFEALLDMSQLANEEELVPSLLPTGPHTELHANTLHLKQLVGTHYPFPPEDRELIAQSIHQRYVDLNRPLNYVPPQSSSGEKENLSLRDWCDLPGDLKESNREQADDIAVKLRAVGLWFRKAVSQSIPPSAADTALNEELVGQLAIAEHDRWVAEKRRNGWIAAAGTSRKDRDDKRLLHNYLFRWDELTKSIKDLDRDAVRLIPKHLAAAGYEIVKLS